ncbi:MAG: amidohydrolase family protein [Candidatus Bathycorpusculaceae bacterium]
MIIDIHVHPFHRETEILNEMRRAGVDHAVLLGVDADPLDVDKPEVKNRLRSRHLESLFGFRYFRFTSIEDEIKRFFQELIIYYPDLKSSNQEIADLVKKNPDKFIGFGSVNPNKNEEYVEAKLREISDFGFKGIKMLPTLQMFTPVENKNFERICEYCEKNKKVLLYHTGCDPGPWETPELSEDANPKYLTSVLERYSPTVILAHAGSYSAYKPGIWFEEALELGKQFDNVYFDTAAVSSFIFLEKNLKRIKEAIGLDRLLFGSDYPVVWGSDMKYEADFIKACRHLTEEEKEKILGLNAEKILNITGS